MRWVTLTLTKIAVGNPKREKKRRKREKERKLKNQINRKKEKKSSVNCTASNQRSLGKSYVHYTQLLTSAEERNQN